MTIPKGYISGTIRMFPMPQIAHLFRGEYPDHGNPICMGEQSSKQNADIYVNHKGLEGICQQCLALAESQSAPEAEAKAPAKKGKKK